MRSIFITFAYIAFFHLSYNRPPIWIVLILQRLQEVQFGSFVHPFELSFSRFLFIYFAQIVRIVVKRTPFRVRIGWVGWVGRVGRSVGVVGLCALCFVFVCLGFSSGIQIFCFGFDVIFVNCRKLSNSHRLSLRESVFSPPSLPFESLRPRRFWVRSNTTSQTTKASQNSRKETTLCLRPTQDPFAMKSSNWRNQGVVVRERSEEKSSRSRRNRVWFQKMSVSKSGTHFCHSNWEGSKLLMIVLIVSKTLRPRSP